MYYYGLPRQEIYNSTTLIGAIDEIQTNLYDDSPNEFDIIEMAVSKSGTRFCQYDCVFIEFDECGKNNCNHYEPKSNNHCKYLSHSLYETGRKWHIKFIKGDDVTKYELKKISGRAK